MAVLDASIGCIVLKNSIFCVDHNLKGCGQPRTKIRQGFSCASDLGVYGPRTRLIVTITRANAVPRAKSRFSRPVILRVFQHYWWRAVVR